jgi:hypothetical protein
MRLVTNLMNHNHVVLKIKVYGSIEECKQIQLVVTELCNKKE